MALVLVLTGVAVVATVVMIVRDESPPGDPYFLLLGVLLVVLLVQAVVGLVALAGTEADVDAPTFVAYLLTAVLVVLHTMILRGFLPIFARPDGTAVWHLAASYVWISSSVAARAIYQPYAPEAVRAFLGRGLVDFSSGPR